MYTTFKVADKVTDVWLAEYRELIESTHASLQDGTGRDVEIFGRTWVLMRSDRYKFQIVRECEDGDWDNYWNSRDIYLGESGIRHALVAIVENMQG